MDDDKRVRPDTQRESRSGDSAEPQRSRLRGQWVAASVLALVSVLLIGISVASFATGAVSLDGLFQTTAEEPREAGSAAAPAKAEKAEKDDSAGAKKDAKESKSDPSAKADANADAKAAEADADVARQEASQKADSARSVSSSSAASASSSSNASGAQESQAKPAQPQRGADTVTVRVIVDSSRAGSPVSADRTLAFEKGATAYDAVCGLGLSVNARNTGFGIYVAGIGGLAEFDHGGESGWKYSVNGTFPNYSAGKAVLSDGDVVRWVYVTAVDQG